MLWELLIDPYVINANRITCCLPWGLDDLFILVRIEGKDRRAKDGRVKAALGYLSEK